MRGKNPQLYPFTGLFLPFLGYTARMPLFSRISPVDGIVCIAKRFITIENIIPSPHHKKVKQTLLF